MCATEKSEELGTHKKKNQNDFEFFSLSPVLLRHFPIFFCPSVCRSFLALFYCKIERKKPEQVVNVPTKGSCSLEYCLFPPLKCGTFSN